jgi:hypothetical protein
MTSPAARTLNLLRKSGFTAEPVERWIPGANVRRDLFKIGDVLAMHPVQRVFLLVQVTTIDHVAHRLAKAKEQSGLLAWLRAGGIFEVHGWCRRGKTWTVKRVAVRTEDLQAEVIVAPARRQGGKRHRQGTLFG